LTVPEIAAVAFSGETDQHLKGISTHAEKFRLQIH